MFRVRLTSTKSKATAVQVVRYISRKTVVAKHLGSAHTPEDLDLLKQAADEWIRKHNPQQYLFTPQNNNRSAETFGVKSPVLVLNQSELVATASVFAYQALRQLCTKLFTRALNDHPGQELLLDLVVARLIQPSSKLEALKALQNQFGKRYPKHFLYRQMLKWASLKGGIEAQMVKFARRQFNFNFRVVFYDITTLYFETSNSDDSSGLRQCGFSKDHKFNQPQLVIGLVVNDQGFPISYEVFPGNKFEGHTFIPVIEALREKHAIKTFTVVADAAMISQENVDRLRSRNLHYIVGARLGSLHQVLIDQIDKKLKRTDKATVRISTPRGSLICSFSGKRYRKDKHDTQKQIQRAKVAIRNPGKQKRLKFVSVVNAQPSLNQKLIAKTQQLWGVKGYYTDLKASNREIVDHYQQLWNVEKSFRITKSDLQARPVYHRKTEAIKAHILICFMALAIAKYLEIKSGLSLKKCIDLLKSVKDAKIRNQFGQIITLRSKPTRDVENLLSKI